MRRILVTGAGGFVGRHVISALAAKGAPGDRLVCIGTTMPSSQSPGTEARQIDLLDRPRVEDCVADLRPTHVLHLAARSSVHEAAGSPAATWRANLVGTLNLAEAMAAHAVGSTFLFVSSGEVYGRAFLCGRPVPESTPPQPANAYARTKRAGEEMLEDVLPCAGVKLVIFRPFNHAGPGQDDRFVVASFAAQIARIETGRAPPVLKVGDLSSQRDFLDVRDVVSAYVSAIERSDELASPVVYNISSGHPRRISDILDRLKAQARAPFDVQVAPDRLRPSQIPTASGDPSAIEAALGWAPRMSWDATLAAVLDDARARLDTSRGMAFQHGIARQS